MPQLGQVFWVLSGSYGLPPHLYMAAYAIYKQIVLPLVADAFEYDRAARNRTVVALVKLIALDQSLALEAYLESGAGPGRGHQQVS